MHSGRASVLTATVLAALCACVSDFAGAQEVAGVRVHVVVLKQWPYENVSTGGPVLLQPSVLEFEWLVLNDMDNTYQLPSPVSAVRLRLVRQGRAIPVRIEWAPDMTQAPINGDLVRTTVPLGSAVLPGDSLLRVRGSAQRLDGSAFPPGDCTLELDVRGLRPVSPRWGLTVAKPTPIRILELNSLQRHRQFHMVEGAFYRGAAYTSRPAEAGLDNSRALEHYIVLAWLPGAPWSDSLPLAGLYGTLGMHRDAVVVYRRILPDLIRSLDGPMGEIMRGHLSSAARSFAAEGDMATAVRLLRLEGRMSEAQISEEVERWHKAAPNAGPNPKQ